ncbi:ABC transporter ATP-binding protein [Halospeciosus flavus]|uniref:Molybdate/tungstate import ATP-binding protein WtpC n=1 Tax=Halospeciosus flavus TaxID=3032283 RepID=A0ABD5Z7K5_9EURY|nr:ABC transporter ATP-binding protein [Halospeciosus flavus]
MTSLTLSELTKAYGEVTALRDVSLDVRDGEFFSLVGPSGCGKTTTLRLVAGFEEPSSGVVKFGGERPDGSRTSSATHSDGNERPDATGGRDMTGVPPEERDAGIVFQHYALFPTMTVRENVAYGLHFHDTPEGTTVDERVDELLDLVDLSGMGERDPRELSGGQRQRVALARALAPEPALLLLDEPMSALDARLRERLRVQVKEIQQDLDITTLYVTHDQTEALAISDRIAVMHDGRVEQVGTPEEVYREPATRFVADFVGDNNLFEGDVVNTPHETEGSVVAVDDREFRVPGDHDGRVTVCLRPEHLVLGERENTLDATVESVEFLGDAYRLHCDWRGREVLVKTDTEPGRETVTLGFDSNDAWVLPDAHRA